MSTPANPAPPASENRRSKRKRIADSKPTLITTQTCNTNKPVENPDTQPADDIFNGDSDTEQNTRTLKPRLATISIPAQATHIAPPEPIIGPNTTPASLSLAVPDLPYDNSAPDPASPSPRPPQMAPELLTKSSRLTTEHPMELDDDESTIPTAALDKKGKRPLRVATDDADPDSTPIRTLLANNKEYQKSLQSSRAGPRDPLDKYLKGPFPKVHLTHPAGAYDFVEPKKVIEWDSYPANRLLATPFGFEARQQFRHNNIRARLLAAVVEITNAEQVGIAEPGPEDRLITSRDETPTAFLIHGLTKQQRLLLLERGTWISSLTSFRVSTLQLSSQDYLFTLTGLATVNIQEVGTLILAKWDSEKVQGELQNAIQSACSQDQYQLDIRAFLETISVQKITITRGGVNIPKFNVYTDSDLIEDHELWSQIREILRNQSYSTSMSGKCLVELGPHHCNICHGGDHPSGHCTFPLLEGWNGPSGKKEHFADFEKQGRFRGPPNFYRR